MAMEVKRMVSVVKVDGTLQPRTLGVGDDGFATVPLARAKRAPASAGHGLPPWPPRRGRQACLFALALVLPTAGCVVVPQTQRVYDPDCGVATKHITLEVAVLPGFHRCHGDGCVMLMVTAGVVTVASTVISGSVAVIGNVLYWAERQTGCPRPPRTPLPPG
jgi:hypothetical protein